MVAHLGQNSYETETATPSNPEPDDSMCEGTWMNWENSPDIWFEWVAEFSGDVNFSTCDKSSYDTSMAVYASSCDNQVACNGDAGGGNNCQPYHSEVDLDVTKGETYYIRVGGWEAATGTGTVTISLVGGDVVE